MQRNPTLDFVRGAAILGILLLNIMAFGLPKAAYLNPAWSGSVTLADAWTWAVLDLLAQTKFLTIFALLFGAGLQMLLKRGSSWIQARLTLLVLLGFAHSILFWDGDVLVAYGLTGLVGWRLIRDARSVQQLLHTGAVLYVIGLSVMLLLWLASGSHVGREWVPDAAELHYEQYWKLHGGLEAIHNRLALLADNLVALGVQYGWQLLGMMLVGAALMRSGWLSGKYTQTRYRRSGGVLVALGLLINLPGVIGQWHFGWSFSSSAFLLQIPREAGAPLQATGYLSLAYGYWPWLARRALVRGIAAVGRMALSNYLLQTVICTTLFYHLGWFMRFDRLTLLTLVPLVWAANITFSLCWLRYFRQGPVEWLWRMLTAWAAGYSLSANR